MFRSIIYDTTFAPLTARWYRAVLERLPRDAELLDVGVGTASALAKNASFIASRDIHVTGIDIDEDYIRRARARIRRKSLGSNIQVHLESVHDHHGGPYDAAYFSASFMLLDEPEAALRHVSRLLKPGGLVFFTQTFAERRSRLIEIAKPLLGKFTTVEFGRVTYEDEFRQTLSRGGLSIEELVVMGSGIGQSFRLAVAAPGDLGTPSTVN